MKRFVLILVIMAWNTLSAQDSIPGMIFTRYYYPGGSVSSEGYLRDDKPDGYWKTYYENGNLRAEGNRVEFELDGTWKFYGEDGKLTLSIEYDHGQKQGKRITYGAEERTEENFVNDIKEGWTYVFYSDESMKSKIFFLAGRENGTAYEYDRDGTVVTLTEFRNGFVIKREQINRRDRMGRKQGLWKEFYPSGVVKLEGTYKNDLMDGYFKEYNRDGTLGKVNKYQNGELIVDAVEVAEYDIRRDYYPDGSVKVIGTYKDDKPHGVRKEYDEQGKVVESYVFNEGVLLGMGIIDEQGKKQGHWKEYYSTGQVMAEGDYIDNVKRGEWTYYYRNGRVEQKGMRDRYGKPDGEWIWYYPSGKIQRVDEYIAGVLNGMMTEYSERGDTIARGEYVEGLEEGPWYTEVNDNREEGTYVAGAREGMWKTFYPGHVLSYKGHYIADLPDGKHTWYWDNGNVKLQGSYVMGVKEGDWRSYDVDGTLLLTVTYLNGVEVKYDGTRIEPVTDDTDIE